MRTLPSIAWAGATALTLVLAIAAPTEAAEKKTVTYDSKMIALLSRTSASPGDRPDHEIVQTTRQDVTTSQDPDWNDVPALNYGHSDLVAGSGTVTGYVVRTHRNGDKTFYRYQGKVKAVTGDGAKYTAGEGTVELIGGTGKFANAKGTGTWKSDKGGPSTVKLDLEY